MHAIDVHFAVPVGRISKFFFQRLAYAVLSGEGRNNATLTIIIVDDATIHRLNVEFLGHDHTTDVITFPLESDPDLEAEIYISADTARRQAAEYHVPTRLELARLAIHGILHLCGYDDDTDEHRAAMRLREDHHLGGITAPV